MTKPIIDSLLVANRGEIACRIFRSARRLGIRSIAVFSDADSSAQHVREADEAVRIGSAAARDSYLNMERVIAAARATGARAIHPGYGFLSENAQFAQCCVDAGLVFVGPPAATIAAMGSKIAAKAQMRLAGVPVLPGYEGLRQELVDLESAARSIGMPLMIKPAAGGGGKGMRIVRQESELRTALAGARRLAESSFGDGTLLLERFLLAPRHVEVQIFGDSFGNTVHLGDRDCSIQRRHQKLIEEAPAPGIPEDVRARLRAAALVVARTLGYVSAGTVEFLLDGREFYFMEMNTRLQVEHTVTEAVTGLDLVEWQLRVAAGQALPLTQPDIRLQGHAIEARVCAEDPETDFLPSPGELRLMQWPAGDCVRVDAGFQTGDVVSASYDSLLGKVICWAPSRAEAAVRLSRALDRTLCVGVRTNERWLSRMLCAADFIEARHTIAWLSEHSAQFADQIEPEVEAVVLAAVAASRWGTQLPPGPDGPNERAVPSDPESVGCTLLRHGHSYDVLMEFRQAVPGHVSVNAGIPFKVSDVSCAEESIALRIGDKYLSAHYFMDESTLHLWTGSEHYEFELGECRRLKSARGRILRRAADSDLK